MNQREISEWAAGYIDGDGSLRMSAREREGYMACRPKLSVTTCHLSGFFDSEGYVTVNVSERTEFDGIYRTRPSAGIQHANNTALENRVGEYCESIGIDCNISYDSYDNDRHQNAFRWRVDKRADLEKLLNDLNGKCVVKQPQIEIMLNEILPRIRNSAHQNRRGFLEVIAWKDVMDAYKGGNRGKYNLRYFEKKWGMKLDKARAGLPDGWEPDYSRPKRAAVGGGEE